MATVRRRAGKVGGKAEGADADADYRRNDCGGKAATGLAALMALRRCRKVQSVAAWWYQLG